MEHPVLAIDIGASSGRHVLYYFENHKIRDKEIYRFKNEMKLKQHHLFWDSEYLFKEVVSGIQACIQQGFIPESVAIDTWAVDYVLLDEQDQPLSEVYAYRDHRTAPFIKDEELKKYLFQKTGIQFQPFNTIYQLMSEDSEKISKAQTLLMIPDYLNFRLTGQKSQELTNLSTTQLLEVNQTTVSEELCELARVKSDLFVKQQLHSLGKIKREFVDAEIEVMSCSSHDTASAFLASAHPQQLILSSGTWSLLGVQLAQPVLSDAAYQANYSNERNADNTVRFQKNIMGLWLLQEIVRILDLKESYAELIETALTSDYPYTFDVNLERFLNPVNMVEEIKNELKGKGYPEPSSLADLIYCVCNSLVESYLQTISEIEQMTNQHYEILNIMGGGSQNKLLNRLLAEKSNKKIVTGPIEASSLGNALSQWITKKIIKKEEISQLVSTSFDLEWVEK